MEGLLGTAAALIGAPKVWLLQDFDRRAANMSACQDGRYSPTGWQKGRFPAPAGVGAIL